MVEVIGDVVMPSEIIVPERTGAILDMGNQSGAQLFVSGNKLYLWIATGIIHEVTSAA